MGGHHVPSQSVTATPAPQAPQTQQLAAGMDGGAALGKAPAKTQTAFNPSGGSLRTDESGGKGVNQSQKQPRTYKEIRQRLH